MFAESEVMTFFPTPIWTYSLQESQSRQLNEKILRSIEDELRQRQGFRLAELVNTGCLAEFVVGMREVAIRIGAADAVLVVFAVTVVIEAFRVDLVFRSLVLCPVCFSQKPRFVRYAWLSIS